jgi:hypothetical protein
LLFCGDYFGHSSSEQAESGYEHEESPGPGASRKEGQPDGDEQKSHAQKKFLYAFAQVGTAAAFVPSAMSSGFRLRQVSGKRLQDEAEVGSATAAELRVIEILRGALGAVHKMSPRISVKV